MGLARFGTFASVALFSALDRRWLDRHNYSHGCRFLSLTRRIQQRVSCGRMIRVSQDERHCLKIVFFKGECMDREGLPES